MDIEEKVFETEEVEAVVEKPVKKADKWVHTSCLVVGRDRRFNTVSFFLNGQFQQAQTKKFGSVGKYVPVKHNGKSGKDFKWDFDL